jgi:DNA-binding transcriptional MerR regulator
MDQLMVQLKQAILGIYDLADERFDFEEVIVPVQKTVNKISLPTFDIDSEAYRNKVIEKFGMGQVEGAQVGKLKEMLYQQTDAILKDVQERMNEKRKEVEQALAKISREFIDDVLKEMRVKTEKLQTALRNREENIKKYEQIIGMMQEDCKRLTSGEKVQR